jgi:hypothetical protein
MHALKHLDIPVGIAAVLFAACAVLSLSRADYEQHRPVRAIALVFLALCCLIAAVGCAGVFLDSM